MPMTVVITRDVAERYRGFLASIMPEAAPGVYVAAELSTGVRERLWKVLTSWWSSLPGGSIVLLWKEKAAPSSLGLLCPGPARARPS
jgi:CRISPR-associated protein Cas2